MSGYKQLSVIMQWNAILIEYTTIRNGKELIKYSMQNLGSLPDHALIDFFAMLCPCFGPFISALLDSPGRPLVLTDNQQNQLYLRGCRGNSPGAKAAYTILQQSGFNVSRALIEKARSFYLEKPALKISFN